MRESPSSSQFSSFYFLSHYFARSPSDSSLSSDSSDSEPEGEAGKSQPVPQRKVSAPDFDEDDTGPSSATTLPQTKNEVVDSIITIPELEEVGKDEELEKVGDVMSLIDNVVIVRGSPSEYFNRGSEKALDSDTLLVFEDRKVMGYVRSNATCLVLLVDANPGRYTRLSARLRSLSTKSNSTKHTLSILKRLKLDGESFTFPDGVTSSLSTSSSTSEAAMRAICMTKSPPKMR